MAGKRALGIHVMRTWPSHRRDEAFAPSDIEGVNLVDVFERMVDKVEETPIRDEAKKQSLRVSAGTKVAQDVAVLAEFRVGSWGNDGDEVTDESTGSTRFTFEENDSHPMKSRSALVVVPGEDAALLFSEHEGISSCATKVIAALRSHFAAEALQTRVELKNPSKKGPKHTDVKVTLNVERHQEPRTWLDDALISKIGVTRYSHASDFEVGGSSTPTNMTVSPSEALLPTGGGYFGERISRVLRQQRAEAAQYLGLEEPEDVEDIEVTVVRDGKSKTYSLERESLPSFRRPLSAQGEPPVSTAKFMEAVKEETEDFFESLGRQLSDGWIDLEPFNEA